MKRTVLAVSGSVVSPEVGELRSSGAAIVFGTLVLVVLVEVIPFVLQNPFPSPDAQYTVEVKKCGRDVELPAARKAAWQFPSSQ